jgi:hypothetical protein
VKICPDCTARFQVSQRRQSRVPHKVVSCGARVLMGCCPGLHRTLHDNAEKLRLLCAIAKGV